MTSKQTYPCFACRKAGFDNVMVYLDGKDDQGNTKYLNTDGTRHHHHHHQQQQPSSNSTAEQVVHGHGHQGQQQQQPAQQGQGGSITTVVSQSAQLRMVDSKLDRLIELMTQIVNYMAASSTLVTEGRRATISRCRIFQRIS